jgi:hypothetical protein
MRFDGKALIGVGAAALIMLAFSPGTLIAAAPLLMFALCPLSMLLMARGMSSGNRTRAVDTTAQHGDSVSGHTATSSDGPQLPGTGRRGQPTQGTTAHARPAGRQLTGG